MTDERAIQDEIRTMVAGAVEAMRARDFASIAGAYTVDGCLMLPGRPIAVGHAAIEAAWAGFFPHPFIRLEYGPTTIEVAQAGDLVSETGTYSLTADAPAGHRSDEGKYIVVWRRTTEGWRIAADIINSDIQ